MSSLATPLVTFACTVGGVVVGMLLRPLLPQHHLRDGSKGAIKLGAGVIAMLAVLVLGLMVGSAMSVVRRRQQPGRADRREDPSTC